MTRRRPPPNVFSISCTDDEWERVRRIAMQNGKSISRWLIDCGLTGDPHAEEPDSEPLVLTAEEQRGLSDSLERIAARMATPGTEEAVLERVRNALAFLVAERMNAMVRAGRMEELRAMLVDLFGEKAAEATIANLRISGDHSRRGG